MVVEYLCTYQLVTSSSSSSEGGGGRCYKNIGSMMVSPAPAPRPVESGVDDACGRRRRCDTKYVITKCTTATSSGGGGGGDLSRRRRRKLIPLRTATYRTAVSVYRPSAGGPGDWARWTGNAHAHCTPPLPPAPSDPATARRKPPPAARVRLSTGGRAAVRSAVPLRRARLGRLIAAGAGGGFARASLDPVGAVRRGGPNEARAIATARSRRGFFSVGFFSSAFFPRHYIISPPYRFCRRRPSLFGTTPEPPIPVHINKK